MYPASSVPDRDSSYGIGRSLVVLPTYNERENLDALVPELLDLHDDIDLLVIDDGSPDGTGEVADGLARKSERVAVMHRKGKLGLGTAYVLGFDKAIEWGYDRVVQMDSDFSHRPVDLLPVLEAAREADLVIGSRNVPGGRVEGWPLIRRLISRGGSIYSRLVLGIPIRDFTSGFKCFGVPALDSIPYSGVRSNGYGFQVEMNYLAYTSGLRVVEAPIVFPDRKIGESKMSSRIVLEAMLMVPALRLNSGKKSGAGQRRLSVGERESA